MAANCRCKKIKMHYVIRRQQIEKDPKLARRTKNNHPQNMAYANQSIFVSPDEHLDISMLETWLWDAPCSIRGSTDAPKFKEFILLVFFKRISDVFDNIQQKFMHIALIFYIAMFYEICIWHM
jgi:hypothetical protein